MEWVVVLLVSVHQFNQHFHLLYFFFSLFLLVKFNEAMQGFSVIVFSFQVVVHV